MGNTIRKNLVFKILKESDIWEMYSEHQWVEAAENIKVTNFAKGEVVFEKKSRFKPLELYFILKSDARSEINPKVTYYIANSII